LQLLQAKQEPVQSEPTMKQEIGRDKKKKQKQEEEEEESGL